MGEARHLKFGKQTGTEEHKACVVYYPERTRSRLRDIFKLKNN